jgi:hypothetical protein
MVYRYQDRFHKRLDVYRAHTGGLQFATGRDPGAWLPDDEIPALVSALQNYMTNRAKEITGRAAK